MPEKKSREEKKEQGNISILIGGSGGQGILTISKILASAAVNQKFEVSCLPSYGAEMRGGYVYCSIVISPDKGIFSPLSSEADVGLFMNDKSYKMLISSLRKNAYLLINSSLTQNYKNKNINLYEIPATDIAEQSGNIRNANMILAGALGNIINKKFIRFNISSLYSGVADIIADKNIAEQCRKSIKAGWELVSNGKFQQDS